MNPNKLPAGKYYIGDPCYVVGTKKHEDWLDILHRTNYFDGEVYELGGRKVWAHGTAHGDGCYDDNIGNSYGVDAGLIGAIPIELVEVDMKEAQRLGNIHDFEEDFECACNSGRFNFGNLVFIDTDPEYDHEEL